MSRKDDRVWAPLERCSRARDPRVLALAQTDLEVARALREGSRDEIWANHTYVVAVRRHPSEGHVVRLSIRRQDRRAPSDWRDKQAIKNQLAGEDVEGIELYPMKSRVVDGANQAWIWCMAPGVVLPIGFPSGDIKDAGEGEMYGSVQRPLRDVDR